MNDSIFLKIGDFLSDRRLPVRIVLGVWCLMVVVLVNSYSGSLVSYLTVPVYEKTIDSFEELAKQKEIHLTLEDHSVLSKDIMVINT